PERQARRYPHELSGGMRQRVLIAMMLALEPGLLIADEPTTALDATVQAQILELLRDLAKRRGMALLLITHDLNAVARTADRAAVMRHGRIVETVPVADLFMRAEHPYTRELVAAMPKRGSGSGFGFGKPGSPAAMGPGMPTADLRSGGGPPPNRNPEPEPLLTATDIVVTYPTRGGFFGGGSVADPAVK